MPVPLEVLTNLAATLRISPPTPGQPSAGQAVTAGIVPPLDQLQLTEVLSGTVNLTWITKDVRFNAATLEPSLLPAQLNPAILGGIPLGGVSPLPGVPGVLGQLIGNVPLTSATRVPVGLEVEWSVFNPPAQGGGPGTQLVPGTDFLAPLGLTGPTVSILIAPPVKELTTDAPLPPPEIRMLHARVRLSAGGTTTGWIDLPAVPIPVPVLGLPTLLALFLHTDFEARQGDDDGAVLVVVPANSPFGSLQQLQPTLDQVQAAASALSGLASFAAFLAGLSELTGALTAQPYVQFRSTNSISNLNDITLIQRSWYENDTEAEDELSSIIFVGPTAPSAKTVQLFNARDFDEDEGAFTLAVGPSFLAIVRSLHTDSPVAELGTLTVTHEGNFGDALSSLQFA